MKTLADIEERIDAIRKEMCAIVRQMAQLEDNDELRGPLVFELAEKYTILALQASQFETSLYNFRKLAEQLRDGPCHGPH